MKKQILIIAIIFAIFCFFRFYNIGSRVSFGWDQEQPAFQIRQFVKNYKPILLGPRVVSDKGFYLVPYYTYALVPFFLLTNLHPWAFLFFLIAYNIFFFFLSLYLLTKIFNLKIALFFLLFWSINPFMAKYDTTSWNPIFLPPLILLTWWLLKKITGKKKDFYFSGLGFVLGLGINMHFQFIFVILFSLFFLIINHKILSLKKILLLATSFVLTFFPLLVFDLRHNFLNANLFVNFFVDNSKKLAGDSFSWLAVFTNFFGVFIYSKSKILTILFYLLIAVFALFLAKKKPRILKDFLSDLNLSMADFSLGF